MQKLKLNLQEIFPNWKKKIVQGLYPDLQTAMHIQREIMEMNPLFPPIARPEKVLGKYNDD